jgi:hypothetical protein
MYASIHNRCLFLRAQLARSLINRGRGYHFWSFEHENNPLSSFPYGILHCPLVALLDLILCHILKVKAINHIGPPLRERVLSQAVSDHSSSPIAYTTKHSILLLSFLS